MVRRTPKVRRTLRWCGALRQILMMCKNCRTYDLSYKTNNAQCNVRDVEMMRRTLRWCGALGALRLGAPHHLRVRRIIPTHSPLVHYLYNMLLISNIITTTVNFDLMLKWNTLTIMQTLFYN